MKYEEGKELDLMEYWRVIVNRKGVLFTFAGTVILLVGIYSFTARPKYKPQATLLIGDETSKILSIEDEFGFAGYRSQMREMMFLNTQLTLLKSESLAERVARKLDLIARTEFGAENEENKNLISKVKDFVTFKWLKSKDNGGNGSGIAIDPYTEIIEKLQKGMDFSQIRDTNVLKISYTSSNPILAAEIVNKLAQEFINFSIEKRYATTQQATDFLSEQIVNLREDVASKERELQT